MTEKNTETRIRIAVSRCLLGDVVRYDAREKRDHFIADTLGRHFQWSKICPEVEISLGVPRPKIQLERTGDNDAAGEFRLVMPEGNRDLTREMLAHCRRLVRRLQKEGICGCILKSRSPSCGLSRVEVYSRDGRMRRDGIGLFAKTMADGAISVLYKELIALGIGVSKQCEPCIVLHVKKCLDAGATREQIIEAASVAVMMGGGPAYTHIPMVIECLDALIPS